MITTSAYLSTDAIKLAMDNNIDVIFLDEFGDPFGRVWHSKLGSTTLIEMFRYLVDETVVYMFSQRKVKKEYFDEIKNGLSLNKEGKAALIQDLNETFEKGVRYRGRNIKNRDIIQFECHRIANELIKGEEDAGVGDL
jgi:CRISPR/Cas system-associated endonuclease Cas1